MNKGKNRILGLLIILIGIIWFGNSFDLWNINIFFRGWWTLLIIIPSIFGLFKKEILSSVGGILLGVLFLLASNNIITWNIVSKSIFPIILVLLGLSLLFKKEVTTVHKNKKGVTEIIGVLSGNDAKVNDKFEGASIVAVMGGVDLNLKDAKITDDVLIEVVCVMGGIDIILPDDVNVKVNGIPVLGGMENKYSGKGKVTVTVDYVAVMGAIELK